MISSSRFSNSKLPSLKIGFEMFMYFLAAHSAQPPLSSVRLHLHMQKTMYIRETILARVSYVLKQSIVK